jgi:hypothetical protein
LIVAEEVGGVGTTNRSSATQNAAERKQTELDSGDRRDIQNATSNVSNPQVQNQALQVTTGTTAAAGVAADRYGRIDPTNGRGIQGTQPTPKVQAQMGRPDYHGFPSLVDEAAKKTPSFAFRGNDGAIRAGVEAPGTFNGKPGTYQWIVEPNGKNVNHRLFVGEGMKNSIPKSAVIPGTNAARIAGRALLPVAVGMDAYQIATSNDKPRTAVEKGGAWAASLAASGATAQAAAPLLAAGPVGWVGYGAAVLGAGAVGYFGGGELAKRAYSWLVD